MSENTCNIDLAYATFAELVDELRRRSNALVVAARLNVPLDDGNQLPMYFGGDMLAVGTLLSLGTRRLNQFLDGNGMLVQP